MFQGFACESKLHINYDKCTVIPLNPDGCQLTNQHYCGNETICPQRRLTPNRHPHSSHIARQFSERRPTASDESLPPAPNSCMEPDDPCMHSAVPRFRSWPREGAWAIGQTEGQIYIEWTKMWARRELGLQYSPLTYNMLAISVLSDIAQLEQQPDWIYVLKKTTLGSVVGGPATQPGYAGWASTEDLWHLKDYGLPQQFKVLRWLTQANKLRAFWCDFAVADKCGFRRIAERTRSLLVFSEVPTVRSQWRDWFNRASILQVETNSFNFNAHVCNLDNIVSMAAGQAWPLVHGFVSSFFFGPVTSLSGQGIHHHQHANIATPRYTNHATYWPTRLRPPTDPPTRLRPPTASLTRHGNDHPVCRCIRSYTKKRPTPTPPHPIHLLTTSIQLPDLPADTPSPTH